MSKYTDNLQKEAEKINSIIINSDPREWKQNIARYVLEARASTWVAGRIRGYADGIRENPVANPIELNESCLQKLGYLPTEKEGSDGNL